MGVKIVMNCLTIRRQVAVVVFGLGMVLGGLTTSTHAAVTFDFVPTTVDAGGEIVTDVSGFFEISDAAFANRMADTIVAGEIIDFSFEFFASLRFPKPGSFSLSDLGVGSSDISFKLTIDPLGEFIQSVSANNAFNDLQIFNGATDKFEWNPDAGTPANGNVEITAIVATSSTEATTNGVFRAQMAPVPAPSTIMLMATGLFGLAGYRWKQRRKEQS